MELLPYAVSKDAGFMTYDAGPDGKLGTSDDVGLRPLALTEYVYHLDSPPPPSSNVSLNMPENVTGNWAFNSLSILGSGGVTIPSGRKLSITSGAVALQSYGGQATSITGPGTLDLGSAEGVVYAGSASGTTPRYIVDAPIAGTGGLTKFGSGTLVLTHANSYTGDTYVAQGMLAVQTSGALGTDTVHVAGAQSTGISFEAADQTFANPFTFETASSVGASSTLQVDPGITATLAGSISGNGVVYKQGAGTLRLTGTSTAPLEALHVVQGIVRIDGTSNIRLLDIHGGVLAGSGAVSGLMTVVEGGILSPGAGSLSGTSALTFDSLLLDESSYTVNLAGTTPGSQYDQIILHNFNDFGSLDLHVGYAAQIGDAFAIVNNVGTSPTVGAFSGLPEGTTFWSGGDEFQITYQGGDGNDVLLTVVATPEPGMLGLVALPAAGLLLRRRGRNA